jgi:geranylgeranyl diphosphate synthase type II
MNIEEYLRQRREEVDGVLLTYLPPPGACPERLREAMSYSLEAGGKRLRPVLVMAAAETCGGDRQEVLPAACAIEYIHTYSLIHDDLPAMDDDDYRRGKPTSHKVFGEAMAILAGDALLTRAFEILAVEGDMEDGLRLAVIREITHSSGTGGMVCGQVADMESEGMEVDRERVEYIHSYKTGALITSSVRCGALIAGAQPARLKSLTEYGRCLGKAFQIVDDLLDLEGDIAQLGKEPGSDLRKGKATYPSVVGVEASREEALRFGLEAKAALEGLPDGAPVLDGMIDYILRRRS